MKSKAIFIISLLVILLLSCNQKNQPQPPFNENSKLATLGEVWGFLKYYHPAVVTDHINWDDELLKLLDIIDSTNSKQGFNIIISELINKLNNIENPMSLGGIDTISTLLNSRVAWLEDTSTLSFKNTSMLKDIYKAKQPYENYYITKSAYAGNPEFKNDTLYTKGYFPSKDIRLLALFRYWNIINYFYPHLELNDQSWESVLPEYIPQFKDLSDSIDYHFKVVELTSELNDGHIWNESIPIVLHWGVYSPPYKVRCFEGKSVIWTLFSDSLGVLQDLKIGDQILEISHQPIQEFIDERKKYYSFSNQDYFDRRINEELFCTSSTDSMHLLIQRGEDSLDILVKPHILYNMYQIRGREYKRKSPYRIINDSIGYLNLRYLDPGKVDSVMNQLLDMKKLIIDIRNYPNGVFYAISNYLFTDSTDFVRIIEPNYDKPGEFYHAHTYKTGMGTDKVFKGKVVLLVNEQTQSHAEFSVMCFQALPNAITVGSTTAGTDGNMTWVLLPGDIKTYFTSLGIDYPDGSPTQRVGVRIDHFIKPTIEDIRTGRDPVLELAIEL